jgi:hypothetical protein
MVSHYNYMNKRYPQKAGLIVYGIEKDAQGRDQIMVLAPWSEGRFSDGDKAYGLGKGDVDPIDRDDAFKAAEREFKEEVGLNLTQLLTNNYPGVRMLECDFQKPLISTIVQSNARNPQQLHLFAVKVDNIRGLTKHIQRRDVLAISDDTPALAPKFQANALAKQFKYPSTDTLLNIVRSGIVPTTLDVKNQFPKEHKLFDYPVLRTIYDALFAYYNPQKKSERIDTPGELDTLWEAFSGKQILGPLKQQIDQVKKHLLKEGIITHKDGLHLDTKNRPLRYFQESADILPYDEYIHRMHEFAGKNKLYSLATFDQRFIDQKSKELRECDSVADVVVKAGMLIVQREKDHSIKLQKDNPDNKVSDISIDATRHIAINENLARPHNHNSPDFFPRVNGNNGNGGQSHAAR